MPVPDKISGDVREVQPVEITISTQFRVLDLELLSHSLSNTEELRSEPNFQRVTGSGQQSGCFQKIMLTEVGQHLEKLTSLSQEEMTLHAVVEEIPSVQLFIGDQTGLKMPGTKLTLITRTHLTSLMLSMITVWSGMSKESRPPLTVKLFWISNLILTCSPREASQKTKQIHGNTKKTFQLLSIRNST
jgi:hypothetical protein